MSYFQVMFIYLIRVYFENNIEFLYSLLIGPFTTAILSLPISFGGWEVREITMIQGYNLFNINPDTALIISITIGIINLIITFAFTVMVLILQFIKELSSVNGKK